MSTIARPCLLARDGPRRRDPGDDVDLAVFFDDANVDPAQPVDNLGASKVLEARGPVGSMLVAVILDGNSDCRPTHVEVSDRVAVLVQRDLGLWPRKPRAD